MKILITGGTGTISSGLVKESIKRGYNTFSITRGTNKKRNIDGANFIYGNVFDPYEMATALGEQYFDVVVECLAYNVEQLKISLSNFANRCNQYVFISTAGVYDRKDENIRIKESDRKGFTDWQYTKDKIECEKYLIKFYEGRNNKYTIIRPTVTYGDYRIPFPIATRTPGWTFFQRMLDGKPMLACDNVKFSIIHIDDFSNAVVSLFGNSQAFNEDFHIASEQNETYWDNVIIEAGKILGVEPLIVHVPVEVFSKVWPEIYDELRFNKNTELILDSSKLKSVTKFIVKNSFSASILKIILAMRAEYENCDTVIDREWEKHCDATIYYAYRHNLLDADEKTHLVKYFSNGNLNAFKKSLFLLYVDKARNKFHRGICSLRKISTKMNKITE